MEKLYRSRRDKKLTGLCGGLAEAFNVDATLLRLVCVVCTFFSGGAVILLYVIASLVIPKEPLYGPDGYAARTGYPPYPPGAYGSPDGRSYAGGGYGFGESARQEPRHARSGESPIDEMMRAVENKAMKKEIEELKAKLAEYEKGAN